MGLIVGANWTQGKYGHALNYDGLSNLVVIGYSPTLDLPVAMTEEAWIYPTASRTSWETILHRETDAYYLHASSPAGPMVPAGGATFNNVEQYVAAPGPIPINTWTHLAVTYDGAIMRFYVNGVQRVTKSQSGGIESNSNPLRIGGNVPYGQYFQGRIDEVRVYSRALTASEIVSDMNSPIATPSGSPPAAPTGVHVVTN